MGSFGGGSSTATSTSTSTSRVDRAPASPQELLLTQIGTEKYNDYMSRFAPLNQRALDLIRAKEGRDIKPAMGRANADVHIAASGVGREAAQGAMKGIGRSGSGRGLSAGLDAALSKGQALGDATGSAMRGAIDQEFAGLQKLAAQGRDIQDSSIMSMADAGSRATRAAIARAGASRSSNESFSKPGQTDYSDWARVAGMATNAWLNPSVPAPSWESGVVAGNYDTSFGGLVKTPYYDPANDFNAPVASSSGGFWSDLGSSITNMFGGSSSSYVPSTSYTPTSNWFLG